MSASIVPKAHVDALVLAGVQFGLLGDGDPQVLTRTGGLLWAQNRRAVDHRYTEQTPVRLYPGPPDAVGPLDPVSVIAAIDGYVYESCGHPDWPDSIAAAYCAQLRAAALAAAAIPDGRGVGDARWALPGYTDAPRMVRNLSDVTAQAAESRRRPPPPQLPATRTRRRGGGPPRGAR